MILNIILDKLLLISCRWNFNEEFCNPYVSQCADVLRDGIGLIHHVGERKKNHGGYDKMIYPITDTFNIYEIGTDFQYFLLSPMIKGLENIRNESKCANVLNNLTISLRSFSKMIINKY